MRPTSVFWYLLIVGGYLVICVRGKKICGPNEYPITDYHSDCIPCGKCHEGYGLVPKCGTPIKYQVDKTDCKPCGPGTFNDKYDSSSCNICHNCVDHELITEQCTNKSDTVCSGTCEKGYFFSKKDGTHSCQKCSFCCFDDKDEEVPDCESQGFSATKQHCSPRPDKDCSSAALSTPTTGRKHGSETKKDNKSPPQTTVTIVSVISAVIAIAAVVAIVYIYCRRKSSISTSQGQPAKDYARNGPVSEPRSVHFSGSTLSEDGVNCGEKQTAIGVNQDTTNDQEIRSTASLTNADASEHIYSGDSLLPRTHATVHDEADKVAADVSVDKNTNDGKNPLSRQTSRDSQRSGDAGDAGFRKRTPSNSSFTELTQTLRRKLSIRKDDPLVHNEEQDMDVMQGPIKIEQEPSSQEIKEGSKVEFVFKCKARDVNRKLIYQWFKDGTELPEKNEATLQLKSVTLSDFGCYKCHVSCKDSPSDVVESCPAELDVTPHDGARYKYLSDVDLNTQQRVETLLTQKRHGLGGWRKVAYKYEMDQLDIKSLEDDPKAGSKTVEYLNASQPYLTVYDFCKALKEYNIRRLDIVKELLDHLSVPCSSKVYL